MLQVVLLVFAALSLAAIVVSALWRLVRGGHVYRRRKSPVRAHRENIVQAVRYAAASPEEQRHRTPAIADELTALRDGLLDCWEHAAAFEEATGATVFEPNERRVVQELVDFLDPQDPDTRAEGLAVLASMRPRARLALDALRWHGPISDGQFPGGVLVACPHFLYQSL